MLIYKLTFPNGKYYIGQTERMLGTRLQNHRAQVTAGSLLPVHCAWRKYGEPLSEVLEVCSTVEEMHAAEVAHIIRCGTICPDGYNVTSGGDTAPSKTPAVAAKISAKAKGRKASSETKAKIGSASAANWRDPEYRSKVGVAVRASWTPEMRGASAQRLIARMTGSKHSPDTIAKLRAAKANISAETRAKMSAAAKGRQKPPRSPETKAKIAANVAASWADPGIRAKRSAAIREGHRLRKERKD